MKKFRQNVALALAYIAAAPFLLVGFIIWLFTPSQDDCVGCPKWAEKDGVPPDAIDYDSICEKCKSNPKNRKKKKNRKCP